VCSSDLSSITSDFSCLNLNLLIPHLLLYSTPAAILSHPPNCKVYCSAAAALAQVLQDLAGSKKHKIYSTAKYPAAYMLHYWAYKKWSKQSSSHRAASL